MEVQFKDTYTPFPPIKLERSDSSLMLIALEIKLIPNFQPLDQLMQPTYSGYPQFNARPPYPIGEYYAPQAPYPNGFPNGGGPGLDMPVYPDVAPAWATQQPPPPNDYGAQTSMPRPLGRPKTQKPVKSAMKKSNRSASEPVPQLGRTRTTSDPNRYSTPANSRPRAYSNAARDRPGPCNLLKCYYLSLIIPPKTTCSCRYLGQVNSFYKTSIRI